MIIIFIKMPGRTNNHRSISGGSKESFEKLPKYSIVLPMEPE